MKVALISHEFPPFMIGGIATNCYDLAYSLAKKNIFTTVFCGKSKGIKIHKVSEHLQIVRLPCFNFPPRYFWFQLQNFPKLLKLLKEYSIVHAVNPIASTLFAYFAIAKQKPFIMTHHDHQLEALKVFVNSPLSEWTLSNMSDSLISYPLNDFLIKKCLERSNHIIVPGFYTLNYMKRVYKNLDFEKVSVIYNGINFEKIPDNSVMEDDFLVIYYGQLIVRKGILYLIRAIAILIKDIPEIRLKIFGKGPLIKKIRTMVRKSRLDGAVKIGGHIAYSKLLREIKKAKVVALPSCHEVGPYIAALEAMACRKPLVVFDFPFNREFIFHMKNGILAKPYDAKDLAKKIGLLFLDKNLRNKIGQEAYQYVKKRHNWNNLVDNYIKIYENCLFN
jgi:1,4-alpha-glucan branching enzyme